MAHAHFGQRRRVVEQPVVMTGRLQANRQSDSIYPFFVPSFVRWLVRSSRDGKNDDVCADFCQFQPADRISRENGFNKRLVWGVKLALLTFSLALPACFWTRRAIPLASDIALA